MAEFDLEAAAGAVVKRARELCKQHRVGSAVGFCRQCMLRAVAEHLTVAHPEMQQEDIAELMCEWLLTAEEPSH